MNKRQPPRALSQIDRLVKPFQEFAELEASGGILLIACTVAALVWANSPWGESYFHLWHLDLTSGRLGRLLANPLHFWINDGLMTLFFLLVGLEIKREILLGELASLRQAALPLAAAIGGMVVPAGLYLVFNHSGAGISGWGIPMATDIAFALGVVALLGDRVPTSLRIFLAALAIADDIGAVLVIAFFYTAQISWLSLGVAGLFFAALLGVNRAGVRHLLVYGILGVGLWIAILLSGVHATVAGVLLAFTIPANEEAAGGGSPLQRLEHTLHPWIAYAIMPIFALANAGVVLGAGAARSAVAPISLGVIFGLVIGKPLGIVFFSWLAIRTGLAAMLEGITWRQIAGAGMLGGIGFTMSLFIADLALSEAHELATAKVGILAASIISGAAGALVLFFQNTRAAGRTIHFR